MLSFPADSKAPDARRLLLKELLAASSSGDPEAEVSTPADEQQSAPLREVIARTLADPRNRDLLPGVAVTLVLTASQHADACRRLHFILGRAAAAQALLLYDSGALDA